MKPSSRRPRLFTIGHGNLPLDVFLARLERSSVRVLADVRSNPASARFPWFTRAALAAELEGRGLSYRWFRSLGGRRPPTPGEDLHRALPLEWQRRYAAAISSEELSSPCESLLGLAASSVVAVLCAELDPRRCHRYLLADRLVAMGARVIHILDGAEPEEHQLGDEVTVEPDGRLLYGGKQLELL